MPKSPEVFHDERMQPDIEVDSLNSEDLSKEGMKSDRPFFEPVLVAEKPVVALSPAAPAVRPSPRRPVMTLDHYLQQRTANKG